MQVCDLATCEEADVARRGSARAPTRRPTRSPLLHDAFLAGGAFVQVPAGVVVERPDRRPALVRGRRAAPASRTRCVVAGEQRRGHACVDRFGSPDGATTSSTRSSSCSWATAPTCGTCRCRSTARSTWQIALQRAHLGRDAGAAVVGGRARRRLRPPAQRVAPRRARAPRATCSRSTSATATQMLDFRTLQDHAAPHTRSDLLFKGAVEDEARSVYSGLIRLRPEAQTGPGVPDQPQPRAHRGCRRRVDPEPRDRGQRRAVLARERRSARSTTTSSTTSRAAASRRPRRERLIVLGFFDDVFDRLPVRARWPRAARRRRPQDGAPARPSPWRDDAVSTTSGCATGDVRRGVGAARVDVDGHRLCVVRIGDDWYVIGDECSHADYSLSEGDVWEDEREIECPKHGSTFSLADRRAPDAAGDAAGPGLRRPGRRRRRRGDAPVSVAARSPGCGRRSTRFEILRGVDLELRVGRGARDHGPERLGQVDARRTC